MRTPLAAVLAAVLAAAAAAQTPSQGERAQAAAAALKAYTDQFTAPGEAPFPPPPPIALFSAAATEARNFSANPRLIAYASCAAKYRELFSWEEGIGTPPESWGLECWGEGAPPLAYLEPAHFKLAYGKATNMGTDLDAGARWVCGLTDALRGYFHFHNEAKGGKPGYWVSYHVWGGPTGAVTKMHGLNDWISARYKEASGVDLGLGEGRNALNYASKERCLASVTEKIEEQKPPKGTVVTELMHTPQPEQLFFEDDLSDVDFEKYEYWVYYYDANWQPWGFVGRQSKRWEPTEESFKEFVLCRAPEWVGNYVKRGERGKQGLRQLRHPLQPANAQARDRALIARHKELYCRYKRR